VGRRVGRKGELLSVREIRNSQEGEGRGVRAGAPEAVAPKALPTESDSGGSARGRGKAVRGREFVEKKSVVRD
jgi:hypothetical protein